MDWNNIATTVFTPLEYTSIGLSEEECTQKFGPKGYKVYGKHYRPLEWEFLGRDKDLQG